MKIKTIALSGNNSSAEEQLKQWEYKFRNTGYGSSRAKDAVVRSGLSLNEFNIRSSMSKKSGSNTKIFFKGVTSESRKNLVEHIPALIENGLDVTILVFDQKIQYITIDLGNASANPEVAVYGQEPGMFTYWTSDEKNQHGRDVILKYKGNEAIQKAKEHSKLPVR